MVCAHMVFCLLATKAFTAYVAEELCGAVKRKRGALGVSEIMRIRASKKTTLNTDLSQIGRAKERQIISSEQMISFGPSPSTLAGLPGKLLRSCFRSSISIPQGFIVLTNHSASAHPAGSSHHPGKRLRFLFHIFPNGIFYFVSFPIYHKKLELCS